MKPDKHGFDEMQKARRDKIGHQTFIILFYLVMIDVALYGFGLRWLAYPANIMVILATSMAVYIIRIILANAFSPARTVNSRDVSKLLIITTISSILAVGILFLLNSLNITFSTDASEDNSALILFVVSSAGLIVSTVIAIIKKIGDNKENKND